MCRRVTSSYSTSSCFFLKFGHFMCQYIDQTLSMATNKWNKEPSIRENNQWAGHQHSCENLPNCDWSGMNNQWAGHQHSCESIPRCYWSGIWTISGRDISIVVKAFLVVIGQGWISSIVHCRSYSIRNPCRNKTRTRHLSSVTLQLHLPFH